ncbi:hypothetical protein CLV33_10558 [Jejuia pallidilutea]|uniref:Uncharacterized protein n=1 Tax=Jejuia pallidilutea TaxID=504487 RepID=A0A362X5V5_9FLAO|nr:hypothetical protein CLV33_10558 [Jejuia pallidilutea]
MAILAIIMGSPILSVGIKKPYIINNIHPSILNIRNVFIVFIAKDTSTINDAR